MFKKNQGVRKQGMGRLLSFLLALAIVIMPLSTGFTGTAHADVVTPVAAPTLVKTEISANNYDITLTFSGPVSKQTEDWQDFIDVRATNEGVFYNANDEYDAYSEIIGSTVIVHLDYQLQGDKNQIRIRNGALAGQNGDILSGEFAAHDVANPMLANTAISGDLKTVTLTLDKNVTSVTEYVYDFVKVNGVQLTSGDPVNISVKNGNQLEMTFANALAGNIRIDVLSGALKSDNGIVNKMLCARLNLNAIQYDRYNLHNGSNTTNSELYLYFAHNQNVWSNLSDAALKAAITISKDGGTPVALATNDTVTADENLYIHFFNSLAPGSYVVHIAAGALKNNVGLVAGVITSDSISVVVQDAPVYQGVAVSADRTIVTLTFDKLIVDNTVITPCTLIGFPPVCVPQPQSQIKSFIHIKRTDSSNFQSLNNVDSVALSGKTLVVTLSTPLSGSQNKISIASGAIKDASNHVLNSIIVTNFIDVSSTTPLRYVNSTIDNLNKDWTLIFDKNVKNHLGTNGDFIAATTLSINGGMEKSIDSSTTVEFKDNKIVLHFAKPLADANLQVHIPANAIVDVDGLVLTGVLTTEYVTPNDFNPPHLYYVNLISQHSVRIYVSTQRGSDLADNTINNLGSHLKDYVTYSTDKGATFVPLQSEDGVNLDGNSIVVFFKHVIEGNLQIKIAANALKDTTGVVLATDEVTGDINTSSSTPYLTGSFFTDAPSVLTFDDNVTWRSKVQKVTLVEYAYNVWSERTLSPNEYTLIAGKLTIPAGVLVGNSDYQVVIYSDGFNNSYSNELQAIKSQDSYYFTAAKIDADKSNGITARVKIATNMSHGPLRIIFQLMNGNTAVNIVAGGTENFGYAGEFMANFSVADAATNPNYKVRAFVVSEYSNSPLSVGVNLAKQLTDAEYDLVLVNLD